MLTRRETLGGGAGLMAAVAAGSSTLRAQQRALDFSDPSDSLYAYVKTVGSVAPEYRYTHVRGRVYGSVPGEVIRPLMDYEAGLVNFFERMENGFRLTRFETMHFLDMETGALLESFANPYTEQNNIPLHGVVGPQTYELTPEKGIQVIADYEKNEDGAPFSLNWQADGELMRFTIETLREYPESLTPEAWPEASAGRMRRYGDFLTWTVRRDDLENEDLNSAPATMFYSGQTNWQHWLFMGQKPGHLLWHSSGGKYASVADLPQSYVEITERLHPGVLTDPANFTRPDMQYEEEIRRRRDALVGAP